MVRCVSNHTATVNHRARQETVDAKKFLIFQRRITPPWSTTREMHLRRDTPDVTGNPRDDVSPCFELFKR